MEPTTASLIAKSFEIAAERCEDLTPHVYRRLFAERPDLEPLFLMDTDGAVRGSMLSWVVNVLLDYAGDQRYAENMIRAEANNHEGYGVPAGSFNLFFRTVAQCVQDVVGPDWTPAMAAAWHDALTELEAIAANP
jgi:hemoglobin-like flavoprotein